jgi:hypothetical protein
MVLDRTVLQRQSIQEALVADLRGEASWLADNIETAQMNAEVGPVRE